MPKNESKTKIKKLKKEMVAKKARKKKTIIAVIMLLITAGAIGFYIYYTNQQNAPDAVADVTDSVINGEYQEGQEIYRYGGQTILLSSDGRFTASMAHGVSKSGTFSNICSGTIFSIRSKTLLTFNFFDTPSFPI